MSRWLEALGFIAPSDPMESDQYSRFLFGGIFFDEPVSTSSENASVRPQSTVLMCQQIVPMPKWFTSPGPCANLIGVSPPERA